MPGEYDKRENHTPSPFRALPRSQGESFGASGGGFRFPRAVCRGRSALRGCGSGGGVYVAHDGAHIRFCASATETRRRPLASPNRFCYNVRQKKGTHRQHKATQLVLR